MICPTKDNSLHGNFLWTRNVWCLGNILILSALQPFQQGRILSGTCVGSRPAGPNFEDCIFRFLCCNIVQITFRIFFWFDLVTYLPRYFGLKYSKATQRSRSTFCPGIWLSTKQNLRKVCIFLIQQNVDFYHVLVNFYISQANYMPKQSDSEFLDVFRFSGPLWCGPLSKKAKIEKNVGFILDNRSFPYSSFQKQFPLLLLGF